MPAGPVSRFYAAHDVDLAQRAAALGHARAALAVHAGGMDLVETRSARHSSARGRRAPRNARGQRPLAAHWAMTSSGCAGDNAIATHHPDKDSRAHMLECAYSLLSTSL